MDVAWKDLSVSASNGRVLLESMCGYAQSGQITAIMGPSGSGKSTLLDALAGRLAKNARREGSIFVNGNLQTNMRHGTAAYVKQEDVLLGTLTVLETITYSAQLRLPHSLPRSQKMEMVESVITEMGLGDCKHTVVGGWFSRGLSGGEKRRVSIALEILTQPSLLFMDEPTSGLDSASAFYVIKTIKNLATSKRTVIMSIHQPSSEVFEQFDNLCLLSQGALVYFGDAMEASTCWISLPSPKKEDIETQEIVPASEAIKVLTNAFQNLHLRSLHTKVDILCVTKVNLLNSLCDTPGAKNECIQMPQAGVLHQLSMLTKRSFLNMTRDIGYYWLRIFVYFMLSIVIGSIYFNVGTKYNSIAARIGCMAFIGKFLTFMSIGGFPSFIEEIKVFNHEKQNGYYGPIVFTLANTLSSMPYLLLISLISTSVFYNMVKLHPGFDHFIFFVLNLFASVTVVESLMMCVASIVPNFLMGIITGSGILGLFMLVDGFFKLANELPKGFWKYPMHYIAFQTYLLQGLYENDFQGLEFDNNDISEGKLSGTTVLKQYQVDLSRSKWLNFIILLSMILVYRATFITIIKLTQLIDDLCTKAQLALTLKCCCSVCCYCGCLISLDLLAEGVSLSDDSPPLLHPSLSPSEEILKMVAQWQDAVKNLSKLGESKGMDSPVEKKNMLLWVPLLYKLDPQLDRYFSFEQFCIGAQKRFCVNGARVESTTCGNGMRTNLLDPIGSDNNVCSCAALSGI
ncbi:ABC transporter G family member 11 [Selaginella moellendorffii]|uniref:ABC transporter G family member 11 n=1 Tax=Selaginella moellendorffii TaxID=88036 RepID=UPI000D1C336F|nr:ABC transporter G family member 11 [Selaginella moellendorffii]|eukprot:XP_024517961.1 ABC transporter G family member 11 [Selaginella moellendorffii]